MVDEMKSDSPITAESLRKAIASCDKKVEQLLDLRLKELLTDDEFISRKQAIIFEKSDLERRLSGHEKGQLEWFEPTKQTLSCLVELKSRYFLSTGFERRLILANIASNLTIRDKSLLIVLKKPFSIIGERPTIPNWLSILEDFRRYYSGCD